MRDLRTEELNHVYGAGGRGCAPKPPRNCAPKKSKSKKSKSNKCKSKRSKSKKGWC